MVTRKVYRLENNETIDLRGNLCKIGSRCIVSRQDLIVLKSDKAMLVNLCSRPARGRCRPVLWRVSALRDVYHSSTSREILIKKTNSCCCAWHVRKCLFFYKYVNKLLLMKKKTVELISFVGVKAAQLYTETNVDTPRIFKQFSSNDNSNLFSLIIGTTPKILYADLNFELELLYTILQIKCQYRYNPSTGMFKHCIK